MRMKASSVPPRLSAASAATIGKMQGLTTSILRVWVVRRLICDDKVILGGWCFCNSLGNGWRGHWDGPRRPRKKQHSIGSSSLIPKLERRLRTYGPHLGERRRAELRGSLYSLTVGRRPFSPPVFGRGSCRRDSADRAPQSTDSMALIDVEQDVVDLASMDRPSVDMR